MQQRFIARLGVVAIMGSSLAAGCERPGKLFAELSSPDGTSSIRLSGIPEAPREFWIDRVIRAEVLRNGRSLFRLQVIYEGDGFDDGFAAKWPRRQWVHSNVLRFTDAQPAGRSKPDVLLIENAASRTAGFLHIRGEDLIVAFEVAPATTRRVETRNQGDAVWLSVEGIWDDRRAIPSKIEHIEDSSGDSRTFAITLRDEGPPMIVHRKGAVSWRPNNDRKMELFSEDLVVRPAAQSTTVSQ
jgi:hypothetical protein